MVYSPTSMTVACSVLLRMMSTPSNWKQCAHLRKTQGDQREIKLNITTLLRTVGKQLLRHSSMYAAGLLRRSSLSILLFTSCPRNSRLPHCLVLERCSTSRCSFTINRQNFSLTFFLLRYLQSFAPMSCSLTCRDFPPVFPPFLHSRQPVKPRRPGVFSQWPFRCWGMLGHQLHHHGDGWGTDEVEQSTTSVLKPKQ